MIQNDDANNAAYFNANSAAFSKERKAELENAGAIHCGHCPYNRGENSKRQPRRSWKNKRKTKWKG